MRAVPNQPGGSRKLTTCSLEVETSGVGNIWTWILFLSPRIWRPPGNLHIKSSSIPRTIRGGVVCWYAAFTVLHLVFGGKLPIWSLLALTGLGNLNLIVENLVILALVRSDSLAAVLDLASGQAAPVIGFSGLGQRVLYSRKTIRLRLLFCKYPFGSKLPLWDLPTLTGAVHPDLAVEELLTLPAGGVKMLVVVLKHAGHSSVHLGMAIHPGFVTMGGSGQQQEEGSQFRWKRLHPMITDAVFMHTAARRREPRSS